MNRRHSTIIRSYGCLSSAASDDSLFFKLILGTNYENTKENCLLFLRNYFKNHFYIFSKRTIFEILINELTSNNSLPEITGVHSQECVYLMRQATKKYSKKNIVHALYDFITEKENENDLLNLGININNINNISVDCSNNKIENETDETESKSIINAGFSIAGRKNADEIHCNKFLSKKRWHDKKNLKEEDKKRKNNKKIINEARGKREDSWKKQKNEDSHKKKLKATKKKEKFEMVEENIIFAEKKDIEELIQEPERKGNEIIKEGKKNTKRKEKDNDYKMKLRNNSLDNSKVDYIISLNSDRKRSKTKFMAQKSKEAHYYLINDNDVYSDKKREDSKNMNIVSYLTGKKGKKNDNSKNTFGIHLIKYKGKIYSYKRKKNIGINNNTIYYKCNNRKCGGEGEYNIEKKEFIETHNHDIPKNFHRVNFKYNNIRDNLLKDKETLGYQFFKDNSFVEDNNVVFLKNDNNNGLNFLTI